MIILYEAGGFGIGMEGCIAFVLRDILESKTSRFARWVKSRSSSLAFWVDESAKWSN